MSFLAFLVDYGDRYLLVAFVSLQRDYEEFKVRINGLVAMAQKVPEEGWTMQDGTPWPGNNVRDHPGMIQVSWFSLTLRFSHGFVCMVTRTNAKVMVTCHLV